MTKELLQTRLQVLTKEVTESLENHNRLKIALDNATSAHNALVGRLNEAQHLFMECEKLEGQAPKNPVACK